MRTIGPVTANEDATETARLHAFLRGRVQGVGYRFFVQRQAEAAGLAGWVRNLPDGSVEVLAEGPRAHLETLLAGLRRGPRLSSVETVDHEWLGSTGVSGEFVVRG